MSATDGETDSHITNDNRTISLTVT